MIQVCRQRGVKLAISHPMRFMEQYTEPKRLAQSEMLGGLCSISVLAGNLGLAMNGTPFIEMFRFMTDEPPADVTGWIIPDASRIRAGRVEDRGGRCAS